MREVRCAMSDVRRDPPWRRGHHRHLLRRRCRGVVEGSNLSDRRVVHALALGLDPAWRRLPPPECCQSAEELTGVIRQESDVTTHCYSMVGLHPGADLLLWSLAPSLDALEKRSAMML